jgi:hypothetical protein
MSNRQITDTDVQMLAGLSQTLRVNYDQQSLEWEGSPFAWIKTRPSRQVGAIGEILVAGWCAANGLDVIASPDTEADRIIGNLRTEIKFSTLWRAGRYTFQQFRDQDYQIAICLGVSPFDAHCWVITKELLRMHVIGHTPQHRGQQGADTFWIQGLNPEDPPSWLRPCGGRLQDALGVLQNLVNE